MTHPLTIALIQGSIRDTRFNDTIRALAERELARHGFDLRIVDPRDPALLPLQTGDADATERLRTLLSDIDGAIVVTPEFNHSMPGALKTLIDAAKQEWEARPVAFVSYGGVSGGLRAVEALRPVFAELHAPTLREGVSIAMPWGRFEEDGTPKDAADAERLSAAFDTMATSLDWWARTLRDGRAARPYGRKAA